MIQSVRAREVILEGKGGGVTIDTRLTSKFYVSKTPTNTVFLLAKLEYIVSIILQVLVRVHFWILF